MVSLKDRHDIKRIKSKQSKKEKREGFITEKIKTGENENGDPIFSIEKGSYKDDKPDGLFTRCWSESGIKYFEGTYKNNKENGLFTWWYDNGNKRQEGTYLNGKLNGTATQWYENGQKKVEWFNKNGLNEGHNVIWDEKGKVIWEGDFKKNKPINDEGFPSSLFPNFNKEVFYF